MAHYQNEFEHNYVLHRIQLYILIHDVVLRIHALYLFDSAIKNLLD